MEKRPDLGEEVDLKDFEVCERWNGVRTARRKAEPPAIQLKLAIGRLGFGFNMPDDHVPTAICMTLRDTWHLPDFDLALYGDTELLQPIAYLRTNDLIARCDPV